MVKTNSHPHSAEWFSRTEGDLQLNRVHGMRAVTEHVRQDLTAATGHATNNTLL